MRLYRTIHGILLESDEQFFRLHETDWDEVVDRDDLYQWLSEQTAVLDPIPFTDASPMPDILTPIGSQEVWAAGVTYYRSRTARMEESEKSGGSTFYDKVYEAERPEIFFKSVAWRTVGDHDEVRIRKDSGWDVPEPELTLYATRTGKLAGYTIGNDMSSRSIEGENPLYLPQAKMYKGSAAIGPCLYVPEQPLSPETKIEIAIIRKGDEVFSGEITLSQMKRTHNELLEFLFREMEFPVGVYLMTGTGIIPDTSFTLQSGDRIHITIEPIGVLTNIVA